MPNVVKQYRRILDIEENIKDTRNYKSDYHSWWNSTKTTTD